MSFTDDDLKKTKAFYTTDKMQALFRRLEAATDLIPYVKHACGMGDFTTYCECGLTEKLQAWRRSCGEK